MVHPRQRDTGIDVFKGLLVILMVFAHTAFFLGNHDLEDPFNTLALLGYSGFMFCFGYAIELAYYSKDRATLRKLFPTIFRPLLAFYIAAFCYSFRFHQMYPSDYFKILVLWRIPTLSDLLLGFSLTSLAAAIFSKQISWVVAKRKRFLICSTVCVAATFFPYSIVRISELGLFIGGPANIASFFPVVQYFPLFLAGIYFARHKICITRSLVIGSIVGTIAVLACRYVFGLPLTRFPPNWLWIVGSFPCVLFAYSVARKLDNYRWARLVLVPLGVNSLLYLLVSNILIFALSAGCLMNNVSNAGLILVTIGIIVVIYFMTTIVHHVQTT